MSILLTTELTKLQDVSIHKDATLLQAAIDSMEQEYIKKTLSPSMYVYLLENKDEATKEEPAIQFVADILNGATYGEGSNKNNFIGLKQIIAELSFCFLSYDNISNTRFGAVGKQNQYSVSADLQKIEITVSRKRTSAELKLQDVLKYIEQIDTTDLTDEQKEVIELATGCNKKPNKLLDEWL